MVYPLLGVTADNYGRVSDVLRLVGLGSLVEQWGVEQLAPVGELTAAQVQALGLARVFFHQPKLVFMDEATSLLDTALEARLLGECLKQGISMMAVCHRASAVGFHDLTLEYGSQHTGCVRLHDASAWVVSTVSEQDRKDAQQRAQDAHAVFVEQHESNKSQHRTDVAIEKTGHTPVAEDTVDDSDNLWLSIKLLWYLSFNSGCDQSAVCVYLMVLADCCMVPLFYEASRCSSFSLNIRSLWYALQGILDWQPLQLETIQSHMK